MRIGIFVFEDVEELDLAGPWEVLSLARRFSSPDDEMITVARSTDEVRCFHGLRIVPERAFADAPVLDVLVVPGGLGTRALMRDERTLAWLRQVARNATWITSVCTGSLLLASAGLLDGKRAASHWAALDELRAFPSVNVVEEARYVRDGNVVTSAGVSAGIDMALWLVGERHGAEAAEQVARLMQYEGTPRAA